MIRFILGFAFGIISTVVVAVVASGFTPAVILLGSIPVVPFLILGGIGIVGFVIMESFGKMIQFLAGADKEPARLEQGKNKKGHLIRTIAVLIAIVLLIKIWQNYNNL